MPVPVRRYITTSNFATNQETSHSANFTENVFLQMLMTSLRHLKLLLELIKGTEFLLIVLASATRQVS